MLKSTGMLRQIDGLGRIVIPKEIRKNLDMNVKDEVEIYVEDDKIILKKHTKTCVFCGTTDNLVELNRKYVCTNCISEIRK